MRVRPERGREGGSKGVSWPEVWGSHVCGGGRVQILKDYIHIYWIYWCGETITFTRTSVADFICSSSGTSVSFRLVLTINFVIWLCINISNKISCPAGLQVIFWLCGREGGWGVLVLGYIFTGDTPSLLWQASAVKLFFKLDWFGMSAF